MKKYSQERIQELKNLPVNSPRLLTQVELAIILNVTPQWVGAMKRWGIPLPGGRTTLKAALDWLKANPDFRPYKPSPSAKTDEFGIEIGLQEARLKSLSKTDDIACP
ncbi:MAG: hypothetical protein RR506_08545 [Akkermansia sp.]